MNTDAFQTMYVAVSTFGIHQYDVLSYEYSEITFQSVGDQNKRWECVLHYSKRTIWKDAGLGEFKKPMYLQGVFRKKNLGKILLELLDTATAALQLLNTDVQRYFKIWMCLDLSILIKDSYFSLSLCVCVFLSVFVVCDG